MTPRELRQLIDELLEGEISEADFLRLEAQFSVDAEARREYYDRLALSASLEAEAGSHAGTAALVSPTPALAAAPWRRWFPVFARWTTVFAGLLVLAVLWRRPFGDRNPAEPPAEQRASGFAVLAAQADAVWTSRDSLADRTLVPTGPLHLASGVVQIELFSGVTVIVEGEAEFEIVSPMEMVVTRGRMRAHVPEPARGFRIRTPEGRIVDLGTEFALDVSAGQSEVHVLEGAVEWHPEAEGMQRLEKGEARRWGTAGPGAPVVANAEGFVGLTEFGVRLASAQRLRRDDWERFGADLRRDPRLTAHYRMGVAKGSSRRLPNEAGTGGGTGGQTVTEGAVVAAARAADRWGMPGGALDFSPTGSRVRITVPGQFRSLTLLCWVKINSLDRWYNSLFLTDGHELHEPHWQIMDDGRLFFSVKKSDSWDPRKGEKDKHIFYSPRFWDTSLSGRWLMVATVYDVDARKVTHFVDGRPLSEETVPAEYLVETVTIGAASLGNWGLPERDEARFAVRNLNGCMDEFALFSAALSAAEIREIYEHGRP